MRARLKLNLASDWTRSKVLWTATVPALLTAYEAWSSGKMSWWQAVLVGVVGTGMFGIRDTLARLMEAINEHGSMLANQAQEHHDSRMDLINSARVSAAEAAVAAQRKASPDGAGGETFEASAVAMALGPVVLDQIAEHVHNQAVAKVLGTVAKAVPDLLAGHAKSALKLAVEQMGGLIIEADTAPIADAPVMEHDGDVEGEPHP